MAVPASASAARFAEIGAEERCGDDDKFLAVQAFDLDSQAAVAGRIRRIGALGTGPRVL